MSRQLTSADRAMARLCELCPVCRHARKKQAGLAFVVVKNLEGALCPFCRAYKRVYGRSAHEAVD